MTYFDSLSIDDIREMVDPDRPELMTRQADRWAAIGTFYTDQATVLDDQLTAIRPSWTGSAAERFYAEVEQVVLDFQQAAEVADGNAAGWHDITDHVRFARDEIIALHTEWQTVKDELGADGDEEAMVEARLTYDEAARSIMTIIAEATTDIYLRELWTPDPPDERDISAQQHMESTRRSTVNTDGRDNRQTTDTKTTERTDKTKPERNMIEGHGPLDDNMIEGHGPEGDDFVSILNGPQRDGLDSTPPIDGPVLQNPPVATPQPMTPPPPSPNPIAAPPPTGQPFGVPAGFPSLGGNRPVFAPPPPPTSRQSPFHTPQQNTVRPVIGARPGTTGVAPTGQAPSEGLNRPGMGNRPATAKPTPSRRLIDGRGVVRSTRAGQTSRTPVRGPIARAEGRLPRGAMLPESRRHRAVPIADDVRKLKRRQSQEERGAFSTETPMVPGIIAGSSRLAPRIDPGPMVSLRSTASDEPTERSIVEKLAERPERDLTNQQLWSPPELSPGVITSRRPVDQPHHDPGAVYPRQSR